MSNKMEIKKFLERFQAYMDEWQRLDREQDKWRFPIYAFIMDMWILHKKHKLTENYSKANNL